MLYLVAEDYGPVYLSFTTPEELLDYFSKEEWSGFDYILELPVRTVTDFMGLRSWESLKEFKQDFK